MKLFHHFSEGIAAKPGINWEWSAASKPRIRLVVRFAGKWRTLYVRYRPHNYDGRGIKRGLIVHAQSYEN